MLIVDAKLSTYTMAAGEPFVLDVRFQNATGAVIDSSAESYALSFYKSNREVVASIIGESGTDAGGQFFRFKRDGQLSESLYGTSGVRVELAERLKNGRNVLTDGAIKVNASALGVPSYDNAPVADYASRATFKRVANSADYTITVAQVPYVELGAVEPTPTFTRQPSISSDGSPSVAEVAAFDFGEVQNGTIGTRRLRKDGADYADASGGSFQWTEAGSYVLRVTVSGSTVFADSPVLTVAAAVASPLVAPSLSREPDQAAGTNPPALVVSWNEGEVNRNTDAIQYQYTQSGTYSGTLSEFALASSDGLTYLDSFSVPTSSDLAAGPFKARARIKRKNEDGSFSYSAWSTEYVDTLNAATLPPATTQWSATKRSQYATPQAEGREAKISYTNGYVHIVCNTPRADERYVELTYSYQEPLGGPEMFIGLREDPTGSPPVADFDGTAENGGATWATYRSSGFAGVGSVSSVATWTVNDVLGVRSTPIMSGSTKTGTRVTFYKNGVQIIQLNTTIISAVFLAGAKGNAVVKENAGQEDFQQSALQQFQWG